MSLFDRMKKDESVAQETQEVTKQVPVVETKEEPQEQNYVYTRNWWQNPNLVAEQAKYENTARKMMEADERRAKWQRNAAILGDVARLGAQSYALSSGSTKIDRFAPQTQTANEKMAQLRERHATQLMEFAKQRAVARQADLADKQKRNLKEIELSMAADKARRETEDEARQYALALARLEELHRHNVADEEIKRASANKKNESSNSSQKKKWTVDGQEYDNVLDAYYALPENERVVEDVVNGYGDKTTQTKRYPSPSEMEHAIRNHKYNVGLN